jgi:nucleotide-binding universal stress UspA family protein
MSSAGNPVLYCFDGSEGARRALEDASTLFPGHPSIVVCVWRSIWSTAMAPPLAGLPADTVDQIDHAAALRADEVAAEGARLVPAAESRAVKEDRAVWQTILDVADSVDAPVIVVGSRGLGALKSTMLGSVSQRLVNHSPRPVLVVPPENR